jgi:ABC-type glycerol-3-phosphate transport system substrate-binding protein
VDFGPTNPAGFTQGIRAAYTYGGKTSAFGLPDQTLCNQGIVVYFNKRLFQETGIDPNTPYDMQKAGTWTWDAFFDLAKRLTRDTNGDRVIDVYGVGSVVYASVEGYLLSNGPSSNFVTKDANGLYVNAIGNPASIAALNAAKRLETEGLLYSPPDSLNGPKDAFGKEGKVAMLLAPDDECSGQTLQEMKDDWGMVVMPKGPSATTYGVGVGGDVGIISKSYSAKEQEDIMFAFQLWMATPGSADWKAPYRNVFRDARAIDETLAIIFNGANQNFANVRLIPALEQGAAAADIFGAGKNPQQVVDSIRSDWNQKIAEFNASLPR